MRAPTASRPGGACLPDDRLVRIGARRVRPRRRWLREGIDEAERHEFWNHRHYMAAHLAHVLWAVGRWAEADRIARQRSPTDAAGSRRGSRRSTCSAMSLWVVASSPPRQPRSRRHATWASGCASCSACRRRCGAWRRWPWRAAMPPSPPSSSSKPGSRPLRSTMRRTSSRSSSPARGRTWHRTTPEPPLAGSMRSPRASDRGRFPGPCRDRPCRGPVGHV